MSTIDKDQTWQDIKGMWNRSEKAETINIQLSQLFDELKNKTSEFEKSQISKDIRFIKRNTSQFEKNSINRDLTLISRWVAKLLRFLQK